MFATGQRGVSKLIRKRPFTEQICGKEKGLDGRTGGGLGVGVVKQVCAELKAC